MFTTIDKAIAALLTAVISILALLGLNLPAFVKDPATVAAITGVITAMVTWLVPNKPTSGTDPPKT